MIRVPPTAESMATLPADLPEGLSLGTQVRVRGMKKRPELNGRLGRIDVCPAANAGGKMFWGVQLEGMVSKLFLKASNLDLDVPVGHGRVLQDLQQASSTEQPNVQVTHKVPEAKCPAKTAGVDPADRVKLFVRAAEVDTPADLGPVRDFQQAYAEQPKARATYKVSLSKIPAQAALPDPLERLRLFKEASGQQLDQAEAAGKAAVEKVMSQAAPVQTQAAPADALERLELFKPASFEQTLEAEARHTDSETSSLAKVLASAAEASPCSRLRLFKQASVMEQQRFEATAKAPEAERPTPEAQASRDIPEASSPEIDPAERLKRFLQSTVDTPADRTPVQDSEEASGSESPGSEEEEEGAQATGTDVISNGTSSYRSGWTESNRTSTRTAESNLSKREDSTISFDPKSSAHEPADDTEQAEPIPADDPIESLAVEAGDVPANEFSAARTLEMAQLIVSDEGDEPAPALVVEIPADELTEPQMEARATSRLAVPMADPNVVAVLKQAQQELARMQASAQEELSKMHASLRQLQERAAIAESSSVAAEERVAAAEAQANEYRTQTKSFATLAEAQSARATAAEERAAAAEEQAKVHLMQIKVSQAARFTASEERAVAAEAQADEYLREIELVNMRATNAEAQAARATVAEARAEAAEAQASEYFKQLKIANEQAASAEAHFEEIRARLKLANEQATVAEVEIERAVAAEECAAAAEAQANKYLMQILNTNEQLTLTEAEARSTQAELEEIRRQMKLVSELDTSAEERVARATAAEEAAAVAEAQVEEIRMQIKLANAQAASADDRAAMAAEERAAAAEQANEYLRQIEAANEHARAAEAQFEEIRARMELADVQATSAEEEAALATAAQVAVEAEATARVAVAEECAEVAEAKVEDYLIQIKLASDQATLAEGQAAEATAAQVVAEAHANEHLMQAKVANERAESAEAQAAQAQLLATLAENLLREERATGAIVEASEQALSDQVAQLEASQQRLREQLQLQEHQRLREELLVQEGGVSDGVSAADDQGSLSLRLSDRRIHVLQGLLRENKVPMMAQDWRHKAAESAHQRQEMARAAQLHNKRCFEHEQLRKCFGLPHNATPTKRENCTID